MDRLLIIADDFTGALDTGIQFTKMGIRARIVTDHQYDFSQLGFGDALLSINTDTRPLSPQDAYQRVYELAVHARKAGFQYVYKKTDSGLRGNIGMELKAVMDAFEQKSIAFIPAFPSIDRITKNGIQYINGTPVKDSVFGKDPFEPVKYSDIEEIIHEQTDIKVIKVARKDYEKYDNLEKEEQTVFLFDAETDEDLLTIARLLKKKNRTMIVAGCAGFAAKYNQLLDFEKGNPHYMQKTDGLLALCGSVNQITLDQMEYAQKQGFERKHLRNEEKLNISKYLSKQGESFFEKLYQDITKTDKYILDTMDYPGVESAIEFAKRTGIDISEIRFRIADCLGVIAMEMIERGLNYTFSMTGGDTLMGFMNRIGNKELVPICEIGNGAVLSVMRWKDKRIQVISKSGGFGEENIFVQMYDTISNFKERIKR